MKIFPLSFFSINPHAKERGSIPIGQKSVCVYVCVCVCVYNYDQEKQKPNSKSVRGRKLIVERAERKKCLYFYHNPEVHMTSYFLSDYCLVFFSIGFYSKLGFTWYLQC